MLWMFLVSVRAVKIRIAGQIVIVVYRDRESYVRNLKYAVFFSAFSSVHFQTILLCLFFPSRKNK